MTDRVLVADDDPDILTVVQVNLELDGFEVDTAVDGEDALQKATSVPPNVIVLDIMMPRMDGLTALHRLRSQAATANIPIILLTARGLPEDRVRGLELGADDYITKPFDITELAARVRAVTLPTAVIESVPPSMSLSLARSVAMGIRIAVSKSVAKGPSGAATGSSLTGAMTISAVPSTGGLTPSETA